MTGSFSYGKIDDDALGHLTGIVGQEHIMVKREDLEPYSRDETEDLVCYPEVMVRPADPDELCRIMKYCNERIFPVTPRGAGTGLSGGALPSYGGVLISTERFNRIIEIDAPEYNPCIRLCGT